MAISPPSDIILDVARAADPAEMSAARARLAAASAAAAPGSDFEVPVSRAAPEAMPAAAESFRRFEAMVLQTFIQTMLPEDAEGVYGAGMSGDMWKGMMAEKLADAVAARGGIGIADRVLAGRYVEDGRVRSPGPMSNAGDAGGEKELPSALIEQMQLRLARSLQRAPAADETTKS